MQYQVIRQARFLERTNRFLAAAEADGERVLCHVKNTGRCRELLMPGAEVWLAKAENSARKTAWDLVTVRKGERLVNIDAQAPNLAAGEFLRARFSGVRAEAVKGDSRFDFCIDGRFFIEVKGVTLEENGIARFPDAPTLRGRKHLEGLLACRREGLRAAVLFVIQMENIHCFMPNTVIDPQFSAALERAAAGGVEILAYACSVTPGTMALARPVEVRLPCSGMSVQTKEL